MGKRFSFPKNEQKNTSGECLPAFHVFVNPFKEETTLFFDFA